jgi:putative hydrolase of the HAD superfamily
VPERPALQIDAVLFDYGLVLSGPPDPIAWQRMRSITGLEEAPMHAGYWAHRHDYDRGALTGSAYWHGVAAHAGTAIDASQLSGLIEADTDLWTQLNLPMVEWASRLQRAGFRTGILSNIGDAIAQGIVAKFSWLSAFDHCTWSHELFMAKPEPAIYLKTAEALQTPLQNILFIDDREDNIAAAVAVGMQAIRYTNHAQFEAEMRARGLAWLLDTGTAPAQPAGSAHNSQPGTVTS